MRDFNSLSGAWMGWSIQDGIRITERIRLSIDRGRITGTGVDMDGEFELVGAYITRTQTVNLTRRYVSVTNPFQEGIGFPYDYEGKWDGVLVSGLWHPREEPDYGGPFEMWPADGDASIAEFMQDEVTLALPQGGMART